MTIFTFTGCAKDKEVKPKSVFDSSFTLNYNGLQIKGDMAVDKNGEISIKTKSPASLEGMNIKIKDEDTFISFKGIKTQFKTADLPQSAYFALIGSAINKISNSQALKFFETENGYKATTETSLGELEVLLDKEFSIISVLIKNQGFNLKLDG